MRRPAFAHLIGGFLFVGLLCASRTGRTQPPPLVNARLRASVEIDSRGVFIYHYTAENGARSTAGIWRVAIETSLPVSRERAGEPVVMSGPRAGWRAVVGTDGKARWEATQDADFVLPAHMLAGFSLTSRYPPALGRFILSPHVDPDRAPIMAPADDPGEVDRYDQDLARYIETQSLEGVTLAPAAPATATPDAVLANLTKQVVQARSSGWIANDAIAGRARAKIESARAAFSRRQFDTARTILTALRTEVTTLSGKGLTPEAVTLVDMNIQYVFQLPTKP